MAREKNPCSGYSLCPPLQHHHHHHRHHQYFAMLFKFTSPDLQNTTVIDCSTGTLAYHFTTPTPTPPPSTRSRSLSSASFYSFTTSTTLSLSLPPHKSTSLKDADDHTVAEIVWEDNTSSLIRIGQEEIAGTADIFDTSFMKVL